MEEYEFEEDPRVLTRLQAHIAVKIFKGKKNHDRPNPPEKARDKWFYLQPDVRSLFVDMKLPNGSEVDAVEVSNINASGVYILMRRVYANIHPNNFIPSGSGWMADRYNAFEGEFNGEDLVMVQFIIINWKDNWEREVGLTVHYNVEIEDEQTEEDYKAKIEVRGNQILNGTPPPFPILRYSTNF